MSPNPNHNYERLGGIYLPDAAAMHAFVNPARGPLERRHVITYVDANVLTELWRDSRSTVATKPRHIDEWADGKRQATVGLMA